MSDNNFNKGASMGTTRHADLLSKSTESHSFDGGSAKTPQYIIQCQELFSSNMEGYEQDSYPCLWVEVGSQRLVTYDTTGEFPGDGRIIVEDPVVCLKYGLWAPLVQNALYTGKKLEVISIKRFNSVNGMKKVIQQMYYDECLIKTFHQSGDTVTFSFCALKVQDISSSYDPATGDRLGNFAVQLNTGTLAISHEDRQK